MYDCDLGWPFTHLYKQGNAARKSSDEVIQGIKIATSVLGVHRPAYSLDNLLSKRASIPFTEQLIE